MSAAFGVASHWNPKCLQVYYQNTRGVFIVYDLTNEQSFKAVLEWKREIDTKVRLPDGKPVPVVLLGNKSDMISDPAKTQDELNEFCKNNGFLGGYVFW